MARINVCYASLADCSADDVTVAAEVCDRYDNAGVHAHPCDCYKFIECSPSAIPLTRTCAPFFYAPDSNVCDVMGVTQCGFSQEIGVLCARVLRFSVCFENVTKRHHSFHFF